MTMKKAFDSFTQAKIWEWLNRFERNSDLIEGIQQTYKGTISYVKTNGGRSKLSETKSSV